MSEMNEMTEAQAEAKELERFVRIDRAKESDGFKLVKEMAAEMSDEILYQARDVQGIDSEKRIELLNKSDGLAYFVMYLDECVGKAEEVLQKRAEKQEGSE